MHARLLLAFCCAVLAACSPSHLTQVPEEPSTTQTTPPPNSPQLSPAAPACQVGQGSVVGNVVATTRGLVKGKVDGDSLLFAGIPYAAPPIGELRFRAPEPAACWEDVKETTEFGAQCPQTIVGATTTNENCLSLNVWTPSVSGSKKPVLFFIHGGANMLGASKQIGFSATLLYDGRRYAEEQDSVVVTVNYRLGALGWMAHPAFNAENPRGVSGNYGLLDLIAALRWVNENISSFGGDPSRVMIFGESAGAFNTCALLASPLAAGLFSSALMQSGICSEPTLSYRLEQGKELAQKLGCGDAADVAACLRQVPAETLAQQTDVTDLLATGSSMPEMDVSNPSTMVAFGPTVDGYVLPLSPLEALSQGKHNKVPFAVGSNENEADIFIGMTTPLTCRGYEDIVRENMPAVADQVLEWYPCLSYLTPRLALSDVMTDLIFTCSARQAARAAARGQTEPVFRYYYTHRRKLGPMVAYRAFHAQELSFVFGTVGVGADLATSGEKDLSVQMMTYWSSFADDGDPNSTGLVAWPEMTDGTDRLLVIDEEYDTRDDVHAAKCDFWDSVVNY